ncbi:YdcF family protein [Alkaliphilus peptidifermentans]|uniref:Uncharacterized SAM-binding protein YcdF, DUF218 family n=1 Tax=Alkaliphilus peptidifermentans DSM 18978 TaxID=1120976 RepID=A0A1G5CPL6_9FIRM|nr:YdcF family protein [Alkaliphilus peptidifermentans]SCY04257.1 Uncharacterized SAM-binding protein YcdF, DUF218 family [Alkaliphilus peptidifermentans DSM 18978]
MKKIITYLIGLLLIVYIILQWSIIYDSINATPEKGDAIIVLGCRLYGDKPGPMLLYRLEKALELYEKGYAEAFVVSGAQGEDEWITEAEAMKRYLVDAGVPEDRIFKEENSYNTYENLTFSKAIMEEQGHSKGIIVSNGFHIRRSLLIADRIQLEASGAPAKMYPNLFVKIRYYLREVFAYTKDYIKVKKI